MDSRKSIIRQTAVLLAVAATVLIGCAPRVLVRTPPPPIPFYEQPFCPGPDYIWIPGYWDYGSDGYYWVPGMWELAPRVGWMWTPGYWGWSDGFTCGILDIGEGISDSTEALTTAAGIRASAMLAGTGEKTNSTTTAQSRG